MKAIREYLAKNRPDSIFTKVVSGEPDNIPDVQFLARLPVWFSLLKMEADEE
jgi:hypothetical protein